MAGERLSARFSLRSQFWFRWTGKCFETATSHMQTVVRQLKKTSDEMKEDYLYLLFVFLIYGITLTVLTVRSERKFRTIAVNLTILSIYSGLFIYNLIYNGEHGSGLLWLFYLGCALVVHWIVNMTGIILTFRKGSN